MYHIRVLCDAVSGLCNYTLRSMKVGDYLLQVRGLDPGSGVPGNPQSWTWTVAECSSSEYAAVEEHSGALTCQGCPTGGNCSAAGVTLSTIPAQRGYWSPNSHVNISSATTSVTPRFYICPLKDSCLGGTILLNVTSTGCNNALGFSDSVLCAVCKDGYVREALSCLECADVNRVLVQLVVFFFCF